MTLLPGTRIGPYEIVAALGAGGMGEVYRARDTNLQREVAIKLLPATFAADAERASRFDREAQTLAALNHPNIAQVFGIERRGADACIVMELVEGDELAARIAHGPMAIDEALPIQRSYSGWTVRRMSNPRLDLAARRDSMSPGTASASSWRAARQLRPGVEWPSSRTGGRRHRQDGSSESCACCRPCSAIGASPAFPHRGGALRLPDGR